MKINRHKVFWALWVGAFLVYELPAVFNAAEEDTFSEFFWSLFRINDSLPLWQSVPIHVAVVSFGIWLIGHLGFGLWGGPKGRLFSKKDEWLDLPDFLKPGPDQATKEQAREYEILHLDMSATQPDPGLVSIGMTQNPDDGELIEGASLQGLSDEEVKAYLQARNHPNCPGCGFGLSHNGANWTHTKDGSPVCSRDRNGFLTGMNGHRWKDTSGPHSRCEGCKLYYKDWGGGPCIKALPGTDYRL